MKYVSIGEKYLKTDITASDTSFKLRDIVWYTGSDGTAVAINSSDFGTTGYGVFEPRTSRQEFFTFDPSTIGNATSTGVTITGRGLPWGSDYSTQSSTRKWAHSSGSKVLIFTDAPAMWNEMANKGNAESISGVWTFSPSAKPVYSSHPTFSSNVELIDKKYADDLAIAGAPDASLTVKGLSEEATAAEITAGTQTGGTSAELFVNPAYLASSSYGRTAGAFTGYAADAGSTDDYAITLSPAITGYTTGQMITFKANTANTGGATLAVNGLTQKTIVKNLAQALDTGDILAGEMVSVVYDGTNFQMVSRRGAPTGMISMFAGNTAPTSWLLCNGAAVSRTTYAALFAILSPTIGTFTITIASPGVVTLNSHGLATGDAVYLTTTGALPTGLSANTQYWVTKIDGNTFKLATTLANALAATNINTSGSQSGTHTATLCPYGVGDGSTTFNVPDLRGNVPVGKKTSDTNFAGLGQTGGESTHVLVTAELPAHSHAFPATSNTNAASATATSGAGVTVQNATATPNTANTGSDTAHNNLQPYSVLNYIIKI